MNELFLPHQLAYLPFPQMCHYMAVPEARGLVVGR